MPRPKSPYNPSAFLLEGDRTIGEYKRCCHCGNHFLMVRNSGTKRGYCIECGDLTCGNPACGTCLPFQKRLEEYEAGKRKTLLGPD